MVRRCDNKIINVIIRYASIPFLHRPTFLATLSNVSTLLAAFFDRVIIIIIPFVGIFFDLPWIRIYEIKNQSRWCQR